MNSLSFYLHINNQNERIMVTKLDKNKHQTLFLASSQGGDVVRKASLPCTTKRRIITNLKTINNQKCQKIKQHGTLTTKGLRKHSPRPVEGLQTRARQRADRTCWQGRGLSGQGGASWMGNWRLKTSCKILWGLWQQENSQSHWRVHWKVGLELIRWATLFPLWPLPHRQHHNTAKRVAPHSMNT